MATQLQTVEAAINSVAVEFDNVSVDKSISFVREAGFAMQVMQANSYVMDLAYKNPRSLQAAITNVAAIGISLNPASKQAYLVPRKGVICLDISYMGMMHLAQISGAIEWGQARTVRQNDVFELNAINEAPTHKYNAFASTEQRGEIVGAYVVVKTQTGDYLTHTMNKEAIDAIMMRSESVKSGKASPWKTDYEEMAKKTVVKQAHKYWPRRERLDAAIHYMDTDGGEGVVEKDVTPKYDHETGMAWVASVKTQANIDHVTKKCTEAGATEEQVAELKSAGELALKKLAEASNG
jgi:recombination protein RecT